MKSTNYRRYIKRLHEVTGYLMSDLAKLMFLLDWDMKRILEVLETVMNSKDITILPISPKGVIKILGTKYWRIQIDLRNFLNDKKPIYVSWTDNPMSFKPILKGNNVKQLNWINFKTPDGKIKKDKKSRKTHHDNYYPVNYKPIDKPKKDRRKPKEKKIKSHKPHTTQSKLICIMNYNSKKIIRIRRNKLAEKIAEKGWEKWNYVPKTAFKMQELKYKMFKTYEDNIKDKKLIKKIFPFKNFLSNIININLLRAFFIKKNDIVKDPNLSEKIDSRVVEIIQKRGKNKPNRIEKQIIIKYEKETKKHISKSYKKKIWRTKFKLVPTKYPIKLKINGKIVIRTKKKLIKVLVEKKIRTIKGKITTIKIPKFITATRCIASIYNIALSKYNIKSNCINKRTILENLTDPYCKTIGYKTYPKFIKK